MSVYYIAEHIITDAVKFEEYRVKVAPMIASYGGRYITKAGSHKFLESPHWKPERVVIIDFQIWSASMPGTRQPSISR